MAEVSEMERIAGVAMAMATRGVSHNSESATFKNGGGQGKVHGTQLTVLAIQRSPISF